ncbi:MAG: flagellar basal body rod protein FlgC [Melioribacteraceae bacterium]|nr:flagellar basal body rod protein FlgC [Melioribacteraceae bacterium]WKZ70181.1 MAG: flagellar basal body rod protein FlgC [Melioribacteraceae bacterium]
MKVGGNFSSFDLSSKGLSLQRKKMDVIAKNIANADATRMENGQPYKRKFMKISEVTNDNKILSTPQSTAKLLTTKKEHIMNPTNNMSVFNKTSKPVNAEILEDSSIGELIFMPNHPDADQNGYVESSNVNIINEMVEMIEATRNYEANLKALNASKEMIKDALEI